MMVYLLVNPLSFHNHMHMCTFPPSFHCTHLINNFVLHNWILSWDCKELTCTALVGFFVCFLIEMPLFKVAKYEKLDLHSYFHKWLEAKSNHFNKPSSLIKWQNLILLVRGFMPFNVVLFKIVMLDIAFDIFHNICLQLHIFKGDNIKPKYFVIHCVI